MRRRVWLMSIACAALGWSAGCVHEEVLRTPESDTTLTITRSGDNVLIGWTSRPDRVYTVMYAERLGAGAPWQPLPSATLIPGTGRAMTVTDRVPEGAARYYRLQIQPAGARKTR